MQSYEGNMSGAGNVVCGGATNGGYPCTPQNLSGGTAQAVVGSSTPTIVKTGATNDGK